MGCEIDVCRGVPIQNPFHSVSTDDIAPYQLAIQEFGIGVVLQFMAEPVIDGDAKAHFRPVHHLVGDQTAERLFQDVFLVVCALDFEVEGDFCRELEEDVVEEGGAAFERDGHGGDIDLGHEVFGEIGGEIGIDRLFGPIR